MAVRTIELKLVNVRILIKVQTFLPMNSFCLRGIRVTIVLIAMYSNMKTLLVIYCFPKVRPSAKCLMKNDVILHQAL